MLPSGKIPPLRFFLSLPREGLILRLGKQKLFARLWEFEILANSADKLEQHDNVRGTGTVRDGRVQIAGDSLFSLQCNYPAQINVGRYRRLATSFDARLHALAFACDELRSL